MAAPTALSHLSNWSNFYVVVGSSAGALIGLQFVVLTLVAGTRKTSAKEISAFGTPTVIHLAGALLIAALLCAPWESLAGLRAALGVFGIVGTGYAVRITVLALQQQGYRPVLEDWVWHSILPLSCYAVLFVAAFLLLSNVANALFMVGIVALVLLFIGIHNAWDTVTYAVTRGPHVDE